MDLKAILKNLGYTDEQIKAVIDAMAENKLHVSSVENPEETIKQLQDEKAKLEAENAEQKKAAGKKTDLPDTTTAEEIKKLQETIRQGKIDTQLIVELTKARAMDVDYLMYQIEKSGARKDIKIDDDGKMTGVTELVENMKKSYASQFETVAPSGVRTGVKKLEKTTPVDDVPQTLEEAIAQKFSGDEE